MKLETLGLAAMLASGCAHVKSAPEISPVTEMATTTTTAKPESVIAPDINPPRQRVVEEVARRVRECGNFGILSRGVVMSDPDGNNPNADAMLLTGVPANEATMECIANASIARDLPKLCMPIPREVNRANGTMTITADCRDR